MSIIKYIVKDSDNEKHSVTCDLYELSRDGLVFYLKGAKVYHFLEWKSYWIDKEFIKALQE